MLNCLVFTGLEDQNGFLQKDEWDQNSVLKSSQRLSYRLNFNPEP